MLPPRFLPQQNDRSPLNRLCYASWWYTDCNAMLRLYSTIFSIVQKSSFKSILLCSHFWNLCLSLLSISLIVNPSHPIILYSKLFGPFMQAPQVQFVWVRLEGNAWLLLTQHQQIPARKFALCSFPFCQSWSSSYSTCFFSCWLATVTSVACLFLFLSLFFFF